MINAVNQNTKQYPTTEWSAEFNGLNDRFFPIFIYGSIIGDMGFSVFDYYMIPEHWQSFLVMRSIVCLTGLVLLFLNKAKKLSNQTAFIAFMSVFYLFFAYGASVLKTEFLLISWNLNIVVASLFWPYFIMLVRQKTILLLNLILISEYILFYSLYSIFDIETWLAQGGLFFLFGIVVSFLLGYSRYSIHYSNFKLKQNLLTSKKKLEHLNDELQEANRIKDRFFSIVAHDLKSPFNNILGFSELLVESIQNRNMEDSEEYAQTLNQSSQKVYKFIVDLLEWARAHTNRTLFKPEQIYLRDSCDAVIELYKSTAKEKQISIINKADEQLEVFADKQMIATVLRNLISNAIKFSHHNSEIVVLTKRNDKAVVVSVSDSGVGISKDNLTKLMKIDHSITTAGTQGEKGTGLGLMICKEFIDRHHGEIWAESDMKNGTTIAFSIPIA